MHRVITHFMQPMQPALQALRVTAPLSWFEQRTAVFARLGTMAITCCGQVFAQTPQPTQMEASTEAIPLTREIAPCGQTLMQSPRPMQP